MTPSAELHSATSFLNSLFLEYNKLEKSNQEFILPLQDDETLYFKVEYFSLVGRHHYSLPFILEDKKGLKIEISLLEMAGKIADHLTAEFKTDSSQKTNFLERLKDSISNIEMALEKRTFDFNHPLDFKTAEQGLFIGHTFHPTPKSRSEFSDADYDIYSPEMAGEFPLEWFLVQESIFSQKFSEHFQHKFWTEEIFLREYPTASIAREKLKEGYITFPVHPWQKDIILQNSDIKSYLKNGKIILLGSADRTWYPTSSLRTIYSEKSDYQLKFSLSVRLTNSIRLLLEHELDRGLQVHDVFMSEKGQEFSKSHPEFEVIYEPAYAGILNSQGSIIQETLIMVRFNPFKENNQAMVLATLTQDHPEFGKNLIHKAVENLSLTEKMTLKEASLAWFKDYLQVALLPLIEAQANYGILLGSHQQNMVVKLLGHRPVKSYFRDCNGTGYSPLGYSLFGKSVSSLVVENGNILPEDIASFLFGYYIMINATFNTLAAIAHSNWISEAELMTELRNFLKAFQSTRPKDNSFVDYLLTSENLMHKGNFLTSFRNINENTEKNPLDIYTKIKNPLFEGSHSC